MKRVIGLLAVLIFVGIVVYVWYFLYGPVHGLEVRHLSPVEITQGEDVGEIVVPASEAEPINEEPRPVVSPTIAVEPSRDEIDGFPAQITIRDSEQVFVADYTGQFRRSKEFLISIDVYDIASYVVEPDRGETLKLLDGLLVDGKAKVYVIRFLNSLPGRPLMNDIYNDINTTFTDVDLEKLQENVDNFCSQFKDGSRRGDTVYMVWLADGKIYSGFNTTDPLTLLAQDIPFARALWRNWSGHRRGDLRFNLVCQYAEAPIPNPPQDRQDDTPPSESQPE